MSFIQWNAKIEVAGARYNFIGLGWGPEGDHPGGIHLYDAHITVEAPPGVTVKCVEHLPNETVEGPTQNATLANPALTVGPGGIPLRVTYEVTRNTTPPPPTGQHTPTGKARNYATQVTQHAGQAKAPDGFLSGVGIAPIGNRFVVDVLV